jgi:hypothetical protein
MPFGFIVQRANGGNRLCAESIARTSCSAARPSGLKGAFAKEITSDLIFKMATLSFKSTIPPYFLNPTIFQVPEGLRLPNSSPDGFNGPQALVNNCTPHLQRAEHLSRAFGCWERVAHKIAKGF